MLESVHLGKEGGKGEGGKGKERGNQPSPLCGISSNTSSV